MDAGTGEIVASALTDSGGDDAGEVPALLGQVEGEIASVTADGAYDGEPVYRAIEALQPQAPPSIVIPPRRSAVLSSRTDTDPSQRDGHIRLIQEQGRSAWRKATGHGRRSLVETAISRYKALIGPRMRASDSSVAPAARSRSLCSRFVLRLPTAPIYRARVFKVPISAGSSNLGSWVRIAM